MRRYLLLLPIVLAFSLLAAITALAQQPAVGLNPRAVGGSDGASAAALAADVPITAPVLSEGFEAGSAPAGWSYYLATPDSQLWSVTSLRASGASTYSIYHNDDYGHQDAWLITPLITPTAISELVFWQSENYVYSHTRHSLLVSLGSGEPKDGHFSELLVLDPAPDPGWEEVRVDLSGYAGQPLYMAFRYESDLGGDDDEWYIDDVGVTSGLLAWYNGPKSPGEVVTFEAMAPTGTNVDYVWSLDSGVVRPGRVVTHVYPLPGHYTAVVTASNTVGLMIRTVDVFIGFQIYLPLTTRQ